VSLCYHPNPEQIIHPFLLPSPLSQPSLPHLGETLHCLDRLQRVRISSSCAFRVRPRQCTVECYCSRKMYQYDWTCLFWRCVQYHRWYLHYCASNSSIEELESEFEEESKLDFYVCIRVFVSSRLFQPSFGSLIKLSLQCLHHQCRPSKVRDRVHVEPTRCNM
jgi:hypothetical protein